MRSPRRSLARGTVFVAVFPGVLLAFLALSRPAQACAGCRNPSLPLSRVSNALLIPGQLRASAVFTATSLNVVHEAGCLDPANCDEIPAQPRFLHDQDILAGELRAVAELALSPAFGLEAQIPFRLTRTEIQYTTLQGAPYQPLDPDVHHRDETLPGLGDPWLLARLQAAPLGTILTARLGVSLPVGQTEADPFALGDQGLRHQHIQFGTGTFDPVLMLDLSRRLRPVEVSLYGQAQLSLYENDKGFRGGQRLFAGVQAGGAVWKALVASAGLDVAYEGPERWGGRIQQDGNLGRTELLGALSLTHPFGRSLATLVVRVPFYRHIVSGDEPQGRLSSPLSLGLMVSRTFGGGV